jgi:hypothetical protein
MQLVDERRLALSDSVELLAAGRDPRRREHHGPPAARPPERPLRLPGRLAHPRAVPRRDFGYYWSPRALVNAMTFAEKPGDDAAQAAWARLIDDAFCR